VLAELGGFDCVGLVLRQPRTASVPVFTDLATGLGQTRPDFVLGLTPAHTTPRLLRTAAERGVPVLAQAPPAGGARELAELRDVAATGLIQIGEPYPLLPGHAAQLAVVRRGLIGQVWQVHVCSAPTWHAMALLRACLGVAPGPAVVRAHRVVSDLVDPLDPGGSWGSEAKRPGGMVLASVDFGDGRSGIYDYTDNQTRNLLRTRRLLVRGSHGEIAGEAVVRLGEHHLITTTHFVRRQAEPDRDSAGYSTHQIRLGDQVMWSNPWPEQRWSDDELAVAELLVRMRDWVAGVGEPPYPLAQGLYDAQLGAAIDQAVAQDHAIERAGVPRIAPTNWPGSPTPAPPLALSPASLPASPA
jgi:predicted dehydrogenase